MDHYTTGANVYFRFKTSEYDIKAIQDYKTLVQTCTKPFFCDLYNQIIGQTYYRLEDYENPLIYLTKLTGLTSAGLLFLIAQCYNQTKQYEMAFDFYRKCFEEGNGCYDLERKMSYIDIVLQELKRLSQKSPA